MTISFSVWINGQYSNELNANRPGSTEGAYVSDPNVYQIEIDLGFNSIYQFEESLIFGNQPNSYTSFDPSITLRVGTKYFNSELIASFWLKRGSFENVIDSLPDVEVGHLIDESRLFLGLKSIFFEPRQVLDDPDIFSWRRTNKKLTWKAILPTISFIAGMDYRVSKPMRFDNIHEFFERDKLKYTRLEKPKNRFTGKFILITQNTITRNFSLVTNTGFNNIGTNRTGADQFFFEVSLNINLDEQWSSFIQSSVRTIRFEEEEKEYWRSYSRSVCTGLAYLASERLQFHGSVEITPLQDYPNQLYLSVGCAFRLN